MRDLTDLQRLVARLRAPDGCPWDREQRLEDLRAYLLEEAHEVAAAVDSRDWSQLCSELGDLLFQIAFVLELAAEASAFSLHEVLDGAYRKMVDRHPHVFGHDRLHSSREVREAWERRKAKEHGGRSALAGVPHSLPALLAAYRIGQKAAGVGFDWPDVSGVLAKIEEEIAEVRQATDDGQTHEQVREELGDLLFSAANLARHLRVDPEAALAAANRKFSRRFVNLERRLEQSGRTFQDTALDELEELWNEIKASESEHP